MPLTLVSGLPELRELDKVRVGGSAFYKVHAMTVAPRFVALSSIVDMCKFSELVKNKFNPIQHFVG